MSFFVDDLIQVVVKYLVSRADHLLKERHDLAPKPVDAESVSEIFGPLFSGSAIQALNCSFNFLGSTASIPIERRRPDVFFESQWRLVFKPGSAEFLFTWRGICHGAWPINLYNLPARIDQS